MRPTGKRVLYPRRASSPFLLRSSSWLACVCRSPPQILPQKTVKGKNKGQQQSSLGWWGHLCTDEGPGSPTSVRSNHPHRLPRWARSSLAHRAEQSSAFQRRVSEHPQQLSCEQCIVPRLTGHQKCHVRICKKPASLNSHPQNQDK